MKILEFLIISYFKSFVATLAVAMVSILLGMSLLMLASGMSFITGVELPQDPNGYDSVSKIFVSFLSLLFVSLFWNAVFCKVTGKDNFFNFKNW
jgi:hypothetical protein